MMIAVGLTVPQLGNHVTRAAARTFCERAEVLGFASLWVQEHIFYPLHPTSPYAGRPGVPAPETYQTTFAATELLAAAAAWTETIAIGTSILVGGYHRPVELAQRLATIDQLSGGRLTAGLSVGWSEDEHKQMDVDFHTRGRRMDELVAALLACWGPDPVMFEGEFFQIPASVIRPKPFKSRTPRLLSGMKSPAGLRRTAALFDIWNPASGTTEQIQQMAATIARQRPADRDPIEIFQRIFTAPPFTGPGLAPQSVHDLVGAVRRAEDAGFSQVIIDLSFDDRIQSPDDWAQTPDHLSAVLEAAA